MFKNYLKITLRNLYRHKLYALINIFGLTLGLGCCLILSLYILSELSYDRHYEDHERIYRIVNDYTFNGVSNEAAMSSASLGELLRMDNPDVIEDYIRFQRPGGNQSGTVFRHDLDTYYWDNVYLASVNTFDFFSHDILYGNPEGALSDGLSVAVSETFARTYFGDANPIGEVVSTDTADYQVTLVFADLPETTHMKYDVLISINRVGDLPDNEAQLMRMLGNIGNYTYVKVREGFAEEDFEPILSRFAEDRVQAMARGFGLTDFTARFWAQNLADVHLTSNFEFDEPAGNIFYIYSFAGVALFILVIACINYVNLATARSMQRAREVGMRKVLGAERSQLIVQFLGESLFFVFVAMLIALATTYFLFSNELLGDLFGNEIYTVELLSSTILVPLIGLSLLVGILSGLYPAFYLSSVAPVVALSGESQATGSGRLRQVLVFAQFTISIGIIASTLLMANQMRYVSNLGLGFDKENKMVVPLRGADLIETLPALRNELATNPNIIATTTAQNIPGGQVGLGAVNVESELGTMELQSLNLMNVGEDFMSTMGIQVVEGRDFSQKFLTDVGVSMVVNQTFVEQMGWRQAIGKRIESAGGPGLDGRVIGVVEDFHYASLYTDVGPLAVVAMPQDFSDATAENRALATNNLIINVSGQNLGQTLGFIRDIMQRFDPNHPFEYTFLDEDLDQLYTAEQIVLRLVGLFAGICVFVSCLGLFGLASFTTQRRTKEIGVRKVLGASTSQIILLLARSIVILVLIGAVVASIASFIIINEWLNTFAYRDAINPGVFVIATVLAVIVAVVTVALQSYRTVRQNPVVALRYE
jgi:putative ABC transport system permease protein